MMILTTLATAGAMLTHPMQAQPAPEPAQIDLKCRLIVIKDADLTLDREIADDDDGRSIFTIPDLYLGSKPKILATAAVLDIGDGTVVFTPGQAGHAIDLSASHGRATMISQPRVLTLAGQEAAITIGSEVTIVESFSGPDDEGFFRVKFGKKMEGVEISFVAEVVPGGVRIDPLEFTISTIKGSTRVVSFNGLTLDAPMIAQRHIEISVTLPPNALAIVPIGPMPDKSGYMIAAISARAIVPGEPQETTNSPDNP